MNTIDFPLERLSVFCAVAAECSFSRGARRIFRTQPAVSQSIAVLESRLGHRLFERRGRTIALTAAGQLLFEYSKQAFTALEIAQAQLEGLGTLKRGRLRISASVTTTRYLLIEALAKFRKQYPQVEISISNRTSPGVLRNVLEREVDLGFLTLPTKHPNLMIYNLCPREDVLICSPHHVFAGRKRMSLQDIADAPLLVLDRGSSTRTLIESEFKKARLTPKISMELASIEAIKEFVQLDFGISIVPRIAVEKEIRRKELVGIRIFKKSSTRFLALIHLTSNALSPAASEFMKIAKCMIKRA